MIKFNVNQIYIIFFLNTDPGVLYQTQNNVWFVRLHWPNNEVPYIISAAFTADERAVIAEGIKLIEDNTCVRYVFIAGRRWGMRRISTTGGGAIFIFPSNPLNPPWIETKINLKLPFNLFFSSFFFNKHSNQSHTK